MREMTFRIRFDVTKNSIWNSIFFYYISSVLIMFLISRMEVRSPVCRLPSSQTLSSPLPNLYLSRINKGENQEVAQILVLIGNFLHEHDILWGRLSEASSYPFELYIFWKWYLLWLYCRQTELLNIFCYIPVFKYLLLVIIHSRLSTHNVIEGVTVMYDYSCIYLHLCQVMSWKLRTVDP